jgi:hypothetical protein
MADIFISYKTERRKAAEHLAAVLSLYGYSVWFDYDLIKGRDFGLQIGREIRAARALVVLWCSLSVSSRWVVEEADLGDELGILIPAIIEPCQLPVGFRRKDFIDLSPWDGSPRSHQFDPLLRALSTRIGRPPALDFNALLNYEGTWRRFGAPSLRAFTLDTPLAGVEGDRKIPHAGTGPGAAAPAAVDRPGLLAVAAQEWPAVRDSGDPERLALFERHFAGTFHAGEARLLREKIEAGARQRAAAEERRVREQQAREQQAREQRFRAEGSMWWLRPGAGEPFCDIDGGPEMVVVPAGKFMMGSPEDEPERKTLAKESPRHEVTIAYPFAVGRHA